jgi:hypothetical protein
MFNKIIQDEININNIMQEYYTNLINKLPKGSIIVKNKENNKYLYLHYKENDKTKNEYYGNYSKYDELLELINRRNHYKEILNKLKIELKKLERIGNIK